MSSNVWRKQPRTCQWHSLYCPSFKSAVTVSVNDWIINEPFTRLKLSTSMSNKQIALQPKITSTLAISSLRLTDDQRTLLYGDKQIRLAYYFPPLIPYWSSTRRDHLISSHCRLLLVRAQYTLLVTPWIHVTKSTRRIYLFTHNPSQRQANFPGANDMDHV